MKYSTPKSQHYHFNRIFENEFPTQADMVLAIAKERRLELAFEGQRRFDLIRTGTAIAVMNAQKDGAGNNLNYNVQPFQLIYPVPQQ